MNLLVVLFSRSRLNVNLQIFYVIECIHIECTIGNTYIPYITHIYNHTHTNTKKHAETQTQKHITFGVVSEVDINIKILLL
jgi:hypothetical protein